MLDLLIKRRSVRKYEKREVEEEKIDKLIKAALLAPSHKNRRSWEIIIIRDKNILDGLSKSKTKGSQYLKEAPLGIVIIGDEEISDLWIEDASIVALIIQLTGESLGLSSCWSQIRNRPHTEDISDIDAEAYVQKLLNIPKNKRVLCVLGIGYSNEEKFPRSLDELRYDKIYYDRYE